MRAHAHTHTHTHTHTHNIPVTRLIYTSFKTFLDIQTLQNETTHTVASKPREPIRLTQWLSVTFQKMGILHHTATKTSELATDRLTRRYKPQDFSLRHAVYVLYVLWSVSTQAWSLSASKITAVVQCYSSVHSQSWTGTECQINAWTVSTHQEKIGCILGMLWA